MTDAATQQSPELDNELKAQAVAILLAEAITRQEINAVIRVALRAGFLWRCHPCKRDHLLRAEACACGAPRSN